MAEFVLQSQRIFLGPYNLTGRTNAIALSEGIEALDNTVLGDNTRSMFPGLKTIACSFSGFYDPDAGYDPALSTQLAIQDTPIAISQSTTIGELAWFFKAALSEYVPLEGAAGDMIGYNAGAVATHSDLVRGQLAIWTENLTTSANGTALNLGAASTSQSVYGAVMALNVPTTNHSILPTIQSDSSSGFASPTTQITFSSFTAAGSSFNSSTGNITDTWWRFSHASVSTAGSTGITVVGFIGIV